MRIKYYVPPPDKAVTHRALLLAAVADGVTTINNPSLCGDTRATIRCLGKLGVEIKISPDKLLVRGRGLRGLKKPAAPLDAGESGTTMRLLAGLLAGQEFDSVITGSGSLMKRPMARAVRPLAAMGAKISSAGGRPPLKIRGRRLKGAAHKLAVSSAQVKSALPLAGLYASGETSVAEKFPTRDHTERLLGHFGAEIGRAGRRIRLRPGHLKAAAVSVPGDLSSAAPFIAAACSRPGFRLGVKNIGLNPGRTGFLKALKKMGARISVKPLSSRPEPAGNLVISGSVLKAVRIASGLVPAMIDEVPLLALAAAFAHGTTVISGAGELRHKESDRLKAVSALFRVLGLRMRISGGKVSVHGPQTASVRGIVETFNDHRAVMAAAAGAVLAGRPVAIRDRGCVKKSYPGFFRDFRKIFR